MASILSTRVPNYTFERTIDWRFRILDTPIDIYAESMEYPISDIKMVEDGLGIEGSYKSVIVTPVITATIYADNGRILENYLRDWAESQYNTEDGSMPPPIEVSSDSVKLVFFDRLSNVDTATVLANLVPGVTLSAFNVIPEESLVMKCHLASAPTFIGSNDADFRRLEINLTPVKVVRRESNEE